MPEMGPTIIVRAESDCLTDKQADELGGKFIDRSAYNILLTHRDANVIKPDGSLLLKYRKNVLSEAACATAFDSLEEAAAPTNNRGTAAGKDADGASKNRVKADGTVSATLVAPSVRSGIVGYFDRSVRFPYCRTTAYTMAHMDRFQAAFPLIKEVSDLFKKFVPSRWAAQNEMFQKTHEDFRIPNSVFTTITVNKNWQTAVHKDAGDLAEGFGVLSVLERGKFDGGYLVIPKYKVAVRLHERDLLLYDVHEWHGNTPFITNDFGFVRLGLVFYYRKHMNLCGSVNEELERTKRLTSPTLGIGEE